VKWHKRRKKKGGRFSVKAHTRRQPKRKLERAQAYSNLGEAHDELDDAYLGKYEGMDAEYMKDLYKVHAQIHEVQEKHFTEKDEVAAKQLEEREQERKERMQAMGYL